MNDIEKEVERLVANNGRCDNFIHKHYVRQALQRTHQAGIEQGRKEVEKEAYSIIWSDKEYEMVIEQAKMTGAIERDKEVLEFIEKKEKEFISKNELLNDLKTFINKEI